MGRTHRSGYPAQVHRSGPSAQLALIATASTYGQQEGICAGCGAHFPFRVMEVDHILPRARGSTDHPDNLQLLCSGYNRSKGGKTMAE